MSYFIVIQYPYEYLTVTLTCDHTIISEKIITKFQAIGLLIPTLQQILQDHHLQLTDIACIGINAGPGPFNTLRGIIATANAITFAQKIPLISCNGLDLLLKHASNYTIAILDAFGNDVYFANKYTNEQNYSSLKDLINKLNNLYPNRTVNFIGNGALKHKDFIKQNFIGTAEIDETILFASTSTLIEETLEKYERKEFTPQIFPLYFASPVVKS